MTGIRRGGMSTARGRGMRPSGCGRRMRTTSRARMAGRGRRMLRRGRM